MLLNSWYHEIRDWKLVLYAELNSKIEKENKDFPKST